MFSHRTIQNRAGHASALKDVMSGNLWDLAFPVFQCCESPLPGFLVVILSRSGPLMAMVLDWAILRLIMGKEFFHLGAFPDLGRQSEGH